ncbi:hypothetical protein HanHA89_Chr07g0245861 [Helianthus annuus]|nr:hypothetical protein HanHA89_Chr07g0245861 [Helianthus annuus]
MTLLVHRRCNPPTKIRRSSVNFLPKKTGTPKKNVNVFTAPISEEITIRKEAADSIPKIIIS